MKKTFLSLIVILIISSNYAQEDPIAHWRFNWKTEDATGNYPILTENLPYTWDDPRAQERNGCLNLSQSNEVIECGSIDLGNQFSIVGWFNNHKQYSGTQTLFSNDNNGIYGQINLGAGRFQLTTSNSGGSITAYTSNGVLTYDTYLHFAFLVDKTNGTCTIYINGEDVTDTYNIQTDFIGSANFYLGSNPDFTSRLQGALDDFRIYDRLLEDNEINTLVTGEAPAPPNCTLDRLRVSGNRIVDESGNAVLLKGLCYDDIGSPGHERYATVYEDYREMASWGANCVRMQVWDVTYDTNDLTSYIENYLDKQVDLAEYFGMYAVIDYHGFCQNREYDITSFWNHVASRYAGRKHVIYEILNEPAISQYLDPYARGCIYTTLPDPWGTLKNTAELAIDKIRNHDPNAMVIVNGLLYGYDISYAMPSHENPRPIERENVVYGSHPYPGKTDCLKDSTCSLSNLHANWDYYFGNATDTYPVMLTEFAWNNHIADTSKEWFATTENYWYPLRDYLSSKNIGYISYMFFQVNPGDPNINGDHICLYRADDGNYEPTYMGSAIKEDLLNSGGTKFCGEIPQAPPTALNVEIEGVLSVGKNLLGTYSYYDANGDPEDTCTFRWFIADDVSGNNATEISSANDTSYQIQPEDTGKYIQFCVTPKAQTGILLGDTVRSVYYGPVTDTTVYFTVTTSIDGNGTIAPDSGTYIAGTSVLFVATPAVGWEFEGWTGDTVSSDDSLNLVIDANVHLTVNFNEILLPVEETNIYVNFGHPQRTAPYPWNDIKQFPYAGTTYDNLKDEDGNNTGINLAFLDSWNDQELYGEYCEGCNIYPWYVVETEYIAYNSDVRRIELSQLNAQSIYDITIFASRHGHTSITQFTIDNVSKDIVTDNNVSETADFINIQPDTENKILIECQAIQKFGHINAMVIIEKTGMVSNREPIATSDTFNVIAGTPLTVDTITGLLSNDSDPDNDLLIILGHTQPQYGSLVVNPDGSFEYTFTGGDEQYDAFSYTITDGEFIDSAEVLLVISALPPIVNTILVNFGHPQRTAPYPWNDIKQFPYAGTAFYNLRDNNWNLTDIDVSFLDSWNGQELHGEYCEGCNIYPWYVVETEYIAYNSDTKRIELSQLDAASVYDISIFASRNGYSSTTRFTINGVYKDIATDNNITETADFNNIQPDAENKILIECQAIEQFGHINALTLHERSYYKSAYNNKFNTVSEIDIFPNPVTDELSIVNLGENSLVRIFNVVGELKEEVRVLEKNTLILSLADYENGSYIVQVISEGKTLISRLILKQ